MDLPTLPPRSHRPPRRVVLLRHDPEDPAIPAHFDLLLEPGSPAGDDIRDVPTWRCDRRPDLLTVGESASLTAIAPHRRGWLNRPPGEVVELTPPLGTARVVARGDLLATREDRDEDRDQNRIDARVRWSGDIHPVEIRIEGARLMRLAPPPVAGGVCRPGAESCC